MNEATVIYPPNPKLKYANVNPFDAETKAMFYAEAAKNSFDHALAVAKAISSRHSKDFEIKYEKDKQIPHRERIYLS